MKDKVSKSKFYEISKKYPFLKNLYYFYNIYIRNYKFLKNGSQFGEDKFILEQFDKNYKGQYLDIGCFHPTKHNNTFLLYKKNWSGINIDLNPLTIELFNFTRPKDKNINIAISDDETEKKLYFIDELNTQNTLDKNHVQFLKNHHKIQDTEIIKQKIKTKTIDQILTNLNIDYIDFMNLDIEGHELNVLKNINFKKFFIKIICVEMIKHNDEASKKTEEIEKILIKNNFHLIKQFDFNYIFENKNEKN